MIEGVFTNSVYPALFSLALIFGFSTAFADSLAIGGPEIPKQFGAFNSEHVFEKIILDSANYPLLRSNNGKIELLLAESFKLKSNIWEIRLKDRAKFSNKNPIKVSDVIWSFERCKHQGKFLNITFEGEAGVFSLKAGENISYKDTIEDISECLILEKESTEIFGSEAGKGTNLISSGSYEITDFKEGKNIRLKLVREEVGVQKTNEFDLKGISHAEEGLSQLRAGSLIVFFTEDNSVLKKAESDTTLRIDACKGFRFAARADSVYDCNVSFDLSLLRQKQ